MISGRSRLIALLVAYLDNHFYPDAIQALSRVLQGQGYHTLMFMATNTVDSIDDVLQEILSYQVDGLILASVSASSDLIARVSQTSGAATACW